MKANMVEKCTPTDRLAHANQLLQIIGSHGRRFFYTSSQQRFASFELRNGRVYFIDDYSGKAIYTHNTGFGGGRWRGFTHGGTLKGLIEMLRDYITKGTLLHPAYIGMIRNNATSWKENIWGYSEEAITTVRKEAFLLPIFLPTDN